MGSRGIREDGSGLRGGWTIGGVTVPIAGEEGQEESGGPNILVLIEGKGELEKGMCADAHLELDLGGDMEQMAEDEE